MRPWIVPLLLLWMAASCTVFRSRDTRSALKIKHLVSHSAVFSRSFTGFDLLDPQSGKRLVDYNGAHYFTPASNTKIFTLATCLTILKDSVPALQYVRNEDGIVFRGTGDPTFLHTKFEAWQSARRLLYRPPGYLLYVHRRLEAERFGAGWAWDDYNEDYQAERSAMPVYGNCIQFKTKPDSSVEIEPAFFSRFFVPGRVGRPIREEDRNLWHYDTLPAPPKQQYPFRTTSSAWDHWEEDRPAQTLLGDLLSDTLKRPVSEMGYEVLPVTETSNYPWKTLYSTPLDTVLRRMMFQSDNFIAEQMLMVCSGIRFNQLNPDRMLHWMLDSSFAQLPQRPRWVDGSGLSRYNLASPQSIVQVLRKLWNTYPHSRVLSFFPAGGVNGTLQDWYAGKEGKPYVWAKTGSMSGIHCLSGFVQCKSGKTLIFSFMHNNFTGSNRPWKQEMQGILEQIRDRF